MIQGIVSTWNPRTKTIFFRNLQVEKGVNKGQQGQWQHTNSRHFTWSPCFTSPKIYSITKALSSSRSARSLPDVTWMQQGHGLDSRPPVTKFCSENGARSGDKYTNSVSNCTQLHPIVSKCQGYLDCMNVKPQHKKCWNPWLQGLQMSQLTLSIFTSLHHETRYLTLTNF